MKHLVFLAGITAIVAALSAAIAIDLFLYEPPNGGVVVPTNLPDAMRIQIDLLMEDTRQTVALNLSLLGAAALLMFRVSNLSGNANRAIHAAVFALSALTALASIYCAFIVNSSLLDMLALGVFDISHFWLYWPARLQSMLLLANTFVLSVWVMQQAVYSSPNASVKPSP